MESSPYEDDNGSTPPRDAIRDTKGDAELKELRALAPIYRLYEWFLWRQVDLRNGPKHVGIILDGNRRFARSMGLQPWLGHRLGADKVKEFLLWSFEAGIKVVTLYAFSTENFGRSRKEVNEIFSIIKTRFTEIIEDPLIHKYKVRVRAIGRLSLLPKSIINPIRQIERATEKYDRHFLNIAISYGGRTEIVDAFKKIAARIVAGELKAEQIDEQLVESHLYTAGLPDPDLIVRTSGEERLSGFLLWQAAYSELYFCDVYWPAFRRIDLLRAIRSYQQRERRFGA
ncbi:MAG: polyprenyl diphosphate synthase [Candidatus Atabeyarchaeum deiterrae]